MGCVAFRTGNGYNMLTTCLELWPSADAPLSRHPSRQPRQKNPTLLKEDLYNHSAPTVFGQFYNLLRLPRLCNRSDTMASTITTTTSNNDHLVESSDPNHPANMIPELCKKFWHLGWVTGTGGGASIRDEYIRPLPPPILSTTDHSPRDLVYLAPSGVQKEMMKPADIYVLSLAAQHDPKSRVYLRSPPIYKPSQCTPLFLAAFTKRGAGCCIHTHSQWAVLVTLLLENSPSSSVENTFEINNIEQIKAFGRGHGQTGNLGYHDTLRIPVIENTAHEEDLTGALEQAMDGYPEAYAVLVRRHGVYVWGRDVAQAKGQCER